MKRDGFAAFWQRLHRAARPLVRAELRRFGWNLEDEGPDLWTARNPNVRQPIRAMTVEDLMAKLERHIRTEVKKEVRRRMK